jgi:putative ABC transport system ATP-binding protein
LLRICAGLVDPHEPAPRMKGSMRVLGAEVSHGFPRELRTRVTAVLQDEGLLDELTPRENVELALRATGRSEKLALGLLSQVGLDTLPPRTALLSGGQRKRVALARALAGEPELIFLDEPTAGLDKPAARTIAKLMHETQRGARVTSTVFVITHDLEVFAGLCDGVIELGGGSASVRPFDEAAGATGRGTAAAAIARGGGRGRARHQELPALDRRLDRDAARLDLAAPSGVSGSCSRRPRVT